MSQIQDYASLKSNVVDYQDRSSDTAFNSAFDTFVGLAEDEWSPTLMSRLMEASTSLTTASDGSVALPSDFYRYRSLTGQVNGYNQNIPMIGPAAEPGLYPVSSTGDGVTYARINNATLYVIPEQVQTVTLDYWAKPTGLTSTATTNWIVLNHPTLYFYAVIAQSCLWLKNFDEASSWGGLAKDQLDEIVGKFGLEYFMNTDTIFDFPTP